MSNESLTLIDDRSETLNPTEESSSAQTLVERLKKLVHLEAKIWWAIGKLAVTLIDHHGYTLDRIGQEVDYSKASISQACSTFRAFPTEESRNPNLSWYGHYLAVNAEDRGSRSIEKYTGEKTEPNYQRALAIVSKGKKETTKTGSTVVKQIRNSRDATSAIMEVVRKNHYVAPQVVVPTTLINNVHQDDCTKFVDQIEAAEVWHLDPPYGTYTKLVNGAHDTSTTAVEAACDNKTASLSLEVTVAAIKAIAPKIRRNDVVLLWQSSNASLRRELLDAIDDGGLMVSCVVTWDKGNRPQPGMFDDPFSLSSELLYIIKVRGGELLNHDNTLSRCNVLRFDPITMSSSSMEPQHMFQKPAELNEFIIRKVCAEGALVVDMFGCTGSFCLAAHRLGRKWIYIESNPENFENFSGRLLRDTRPPESETPAENADRHDIDLPPA